MTSDGTTEIQTVAAIRLVLEGAANDATAISLIGWLIEQAPDTADGDTGSVHLLIAAMRSVNATFTAPPSHPPTQGRKGDPTTNA